MTRFDDWRAGAQYTIELGALVRNGFDLGLAEYPIFDAAYREGLNDKILRHYWFREIGAETPGLFKFYLNRKMNEIMPFYNQLYQSAVLAIDPLHNVQMESTGNASDSATSDRTTDHTEQASAEASAQTASTTHNEALSSETPQTQLSGYEDYATSLSKADGKSDGTSASTESNTRTLHEADGTATQSTSDYVNRVVGLTGMTQAAAIMEFRQSMLNVDMLVIDELAPLFMGIWNPYANYL